MTTGAVTRLFTNDELPPTPEAVDVLRRLQDGLVDLLAGLDRAPASVRIKADQLELELHWVQPAAGVMPAVAVEAAGALHAVAATGAGAAAGPGSSAADPDVDHVTAEMVGVFYRAPEPNAKPFVDVGDVIESGQQVGIIESMKLMVPVQASVGGRVVEVLVDNGAPVEYGERLFSVGQAGD